MAQVKFMDEIVTEYNKTFDYPILSHYVSNDMSSNYYFLDKNGHEKDDNDNMYYVDQFDLQESFDHDDCEFTYSSDGQKTCTIHGQTMHVMENGCNTYDNETVADKAQALQELAFVIVGGQL